MARLVVPVRYVLIPILQFRMRGSNLLKATLRELISEVKLKLGDILFHSLFIFLEAAKIFIVRETGKHVEVDNVQHYNKLKSKEQSRHQVPDLNCVTSRIVKIVEFVFKKL